MASVGSKSRILTMSGKRWLAGMVWRYSDRPTDRARIRKDAHTLRADAFVQRSGTVRTPMGVDPRFDVGYAAIGKEAGTAKVYSLGAALSEAKPGPWVGIFQLDSQSFYYVSITSDGAITPDQYGEFVGSQEEILEAQKAHANTADVEILEGDLSKLEALLAKAVGPALLVRQVSRKVTLGPRSIWTVAMIGVALVAGRGLLIWHKEQLQKQREAALLAAEEQARKELPPASPLQTEPPAQIWLAQCDPRRLHLPAIEDGWSLSQFECEGKKVILTWQRGPGANSLVRPIGDMDASGNVVTTALPFHLPLNLVRIEERATKDPAAIPRNFPAISTLQAQLQAWGEQAGISIEIGTVSTVPGLPLQQCAVKIESPLVPWSLTSLGRVVGLRLTSVRSTPEGVWVIEGILYGR